MEFFMSDIPRHDLQTITKMKKISLCQQVLFRIGSFNLQQSVIDKKSAASDHLQVVRLTALMYFGVKHQNVCYFL